MRLPNWQQQNLRLGWWLAISLPLLLIVAWGPYFRDDTYLLLIDARGFADVTVSRPSILQWMLLRLAAQTPLDLAWLTLTVGGLGWVIAAVSLFFLSQRDNNNRILFLPSLLIGLAPFFVMELGTAVPWFVALGWLALWLEHAQKWRWHTLATLLIPLVYFDVVSVALVALLWGSRWLQSNHLPLKEGLLFIGSILLAGAWHLVIWQQPLVFGNYSWLHEFQRQVQNNELLWLIPLAFIVGLWQQPQKITFVVTGWGLVSLLFGGETAVLTFFVAACFLISSWLATQKRAQQLAIPVALLFLIAYGFSWSEAISKRPFARHETEESVAAWLRTNTLPTHTITAPTRISYLAQRPYTHTPIHQTPPDYLVYPRTIAADQQQRTSWFQENYEQVIQFETAADSTSPFTVWGYRPTLYDLGNGRPLNVAVSEIAQIVGYEISSERFQPGDTLSLTIHFKDSLPAKQQIIARLISPFDGQEWAQTAVSPTESTTSAQTITLPTPADLPIGAYQLNFSLKSSDADSLTALFRNGDSNPLDRVTLGNVVVPWIGDVNGEGITAVNARFDNQITLAGYEISDNFAPGDEPLIVTLYWQGLRPPVADYVVFVHLLDENGQLVANHDAMPANGRFPTTAFLPGDLIQDGHALFLDPNLASGSYRLSVGLYLPETGQRLPLWLSDGTELPDRALPLTDIVVP
ncbi:MAG: hypothetical protein AAF614_11750 [Chloroflexota bacterium]